ncbi:MAG: sodium:solute symporter family protein [Verrucomicrobia bacterium]|nr:sodium:solute symporter family protein [Verrucomicrobiota bacterium]
MNFLLLLAQAQTAVPAENGDTASELSRIGIIVMIVYMIILLALGVIGWMRSSNTEEDFYLAGRGQGFLVTVMTIMATFFSSAAILGIPGNVYKEGVAFVLFTMNLPCAGACIYLLGSKIRRIGQKRKYVTQGDMISDYYGDVPAVRLVVALIGFCYVLPYIIMQIKAGGYLAQGMFPDAADLNIFGHQMPIFQVGATALSLVTMFYVLIGGMRSVAWTDVLQGVLLLSGMLLAAVATIVALGGFGGYFEKVAELPPEALSLPGATGAYPAWKLMTVAVFASIGSLVQPAQWIRMYAASSDAILKKSSLVFAVVLPSCFIFGIMLVALAGRAIYPPEMVDGELVAHSFVGSFDQIVIVMIKEQLPAMMGGVGLVLVAVILVAVLAASMSTADSNLHALSAVFTRDIYDRLLRPSGTQNERAWVSRAVIVVATLLALWLVNAGHENEAFKPLNMIASLMFAAIGFSCQLLPATVDMLFIRKGTRAGVVSGMLAGVATIFLFKLYSPFADSETAQSFTRNLDLGLIGCTVNVIVFVIVSKFTPALDREHIAQLSKDMDGK